MVLCFLFVCPTGLLSRDKAEGVFIRHKYKLFDT